MLFKEPLTNHETKPHGLLDGEISTGTTIMAIQFDGGVILGADSRTTMRSYVAGRFTDKLSRLTDNIYCLRSGSAADTQTVAEIVSYYLSVHEMETDEPALVHVAANTLKNICYNNKDQLTAAIIVAGWDKRAGPQVYNVPLGGMLVRQPFCIGGSGSTYIYGYVDANYKENMTKDECIKFVIDSISLAISRDGYSGGSIRLGIITKDGVEKKWILGDEITKFYEG